MSEIKVVAGFTNLSKVVAELQNEMEDYSPQKELRLKQLAISGFRELKLYTIGSVEVAYLDIDTDTNTVLLPEDYVDYTKVGIDINGQLWTLTLNRDMLLPRIGVCGDEISTATQSNNSVTTGYYYSPHYYNGEYITTLYGIGGGFNSGYYRIDPTRGIIQLSGTIQTGQLVLEYLSTGIKPNDGTIIPIQAMEALKAWTYWKHIQRKPGYSRGEKIDAKKEFLECEMALRDFELIASMNEYMDQLYHSFKQTPNR